MKTKSFRIEGSATPGPDYVCSKCETRGIRLWRQSHMFLDAITLFCAACATKDQALQIKQYDFQRHPQSSNIGDLLPARPTPEGDTFWGHTSGDVEWWYALPQYLDASEEVALLRRERDYFIRQHQGALQDYLDVCNARQKRRDR